jgi:spore germination protein
VLRVWVKSGAYLVTIVFLGLALLGVVGRAAAPPGAVRASVARGTPSYMYPLYTMLPKPRIEGFYENTADTPGGTGSFGSLQAHGKDLNTVSPLWYSIGPAGNIENDRSDAKVVAAAKKAHVRVMPLVTNLGSNMLTSPGPRAAAVRSLVRIASKPGYGGVYVDFELLPPNAQAGLTAMIEETYYRLHASGKRLGISVFPKVGIIGTLPSAYDYSALGRHVDEFQIMTYDSHYSGGTPGPVAPYPWVEANLLYTLRYVPRRNVFLGVAFYGYDWPSPAGGNAPTISMAGAYALAKSHGSTIAWDPYAGEGHFTYGSNVVWFETPRSIAEKASLARRYAIGGIAIWRLGYESNGAWNTMIKALKTGRAPSTPAGAQQS